MSHISKVKINIEKLPDKNKLMKKLKELGFEVEESQIVNDWYGNTYKYDDVLFTVRTTDSTGKVRIFGVNSQGEIVGDSYGITDYQRKLQRAIVASTMSIALEEKKYKVSIKYEEKENKYLVEAYEPGIY